MHSFGQAQRTFSPYGVRDSWWLIFHLHGFIHYALRW